ncbi:SCO family protein [Aureimonas populi]|uniref:SCO family protein n=1 Tax=Aureimonas populi TaxID=1701758 RepID=A0ABW5CJ80_9HYPH|nr:SCO family protein [Aureimonas populi]
MSDTGTPSPRGRLPLVRIGLWTLVAVAALVLVFVWALGFNRTSGYESTATEPYGTPFSLVDQNGEPVTEASLRGEPTAIFFGFTHCPDVCPTTLYELAGHKQALDERGEALRVVFVTVDPERDTPDILAQYVGSLGVDVTALTGEPQAVRQMLDGWGIHYSRVGEGESYTMDHTASVILLGSAGQFVGTIAYGENPDTAREKLQRLATL